MGWDKKTCDYCLKEVKMVTGKTIYPHRPDLSGKFFYYCSTCDAYVGCHPGTNEPLGRLANKELRQLKMQAHAAFDPIWKSGKMKRNEAYQWLADRLCIPRNETHIGMFNEELCRKVIEICK